MPLTGSRIVDSLKQAQGVILETLKERQKDSGGEEGGVECWRLGPAPFKGSLASLLAHSRGGGRASTVRRTTGRAREHPAPTVSHFQSARGGEILPERVTFPGPPGLVLAWGGICATTLICPNPHASPSYLQIRRS